MEYHSVEVEQTFLGSLLVNNALHAIISGEIKADDFFIPAHSVIFRVIEEKISNDEIASSLTLSTIPVIAEALEGSKDYLTGLLRSAVALTQISDFAKLIVEMRRRRELNELLDSSKDSLAGGESPDQIVSRIEGAWNLEETGDRRIFSLTDATASAMKNFKDAYSNPDRLMGTTTGISDLDRMTGGFRAGDLVVLGGRPSMGKTAVALSMALSASRKGHGVVFVSLEMPPEALAMRAVSNETALKNRGVAYSDAVRGSLNESSARDFIKASTVHNLPIQILPSTMRDIGSINFGIKKAKRVFEAQGVELGMVVVDYLQLIQSSKNSRYEQITEISIALKGLALRLGVPVVALAQLSRSLESRDNKRPMMSDLRDSGQIEQDADAVIFCYRDEYYLEREKPDDEDTSDFIEWQSAIDMSRNKLDLIVAKQRMGEIGTVSVGFNAATNFIWDIDWKNQSQEAI